MEKRAGLAASKNWWTQSVVCRSPAVGDIEEVLALRDRLDAKLSEVLQVFESERGWAEDSSLSLTARTTSAATSSVPAE
jgi:hypothetical protein